MSKTKLTLFLCDGKDCRRAWGRVAGGSPGKWLKRQVEHAGLPYKLNVVETCCQDRCEDAACFCLVCGPCAAAVTAVRSEDDADRVLATLRTCAQRASDAARAAAHAREVS
jgi:hypothetical protein